jgi:hypothetical protein
LSKLIKFHGEHVTPLAQAQATLAQAVGQLPGTEHAAEAAPLAAELESACRKRGRGPCLIGELLPAVLAKLGVAVVESKPSGEVDSR